MQRTEAARWHYVGHFGTVGPLTLEGMEELVEGGVIERESFVWSDEMPTWVSAGSVAELGPALSRRAPFSEPPPFVPPTVAPPAYRTPVAFPPAPPMRFSGRSRTVAALLNIAFPGAGRMYLGYWGIGLLQTATACLFAGIVWSVVDALVILLGGKTQDAYGALLSEVRWAAHRRGPRDVRY